MKTPTSDHVHHLTLPLHGGGGVTIQDRTPDGHIGRLAELLGLNSAPGEADLPDASVDDRTKTPCGISVCHTPRGLLELRWSRENGLFHLLPAPEIFEDPVLCIRLWRYAVICAGIAAVLRKTPCMLLHGAMLIHEERAIILLGESGIGKSTSANRWRRCGGSAPADDMLLLEAADDGFFVHAMPTWSRCVSAAELPELAAGYAVPVGGVLGLSRGDDVERVEAVSREEFFGHVLRSAFFHCNGVVKLLPEEERRRFGAGAASMSGDLTTRFPPCGLFATLDGDLVRAIEDYFRKFDGAFRKTK